jgi:CYTH domain-containing protein
MAEIEKKYLLRDDTGTYVSEILKAIYPNFEELTDDVKNNGKPIRQGYLSIEMGINIAQELNLNLEFEPVEARLRDKAGKFFFTLKGDGTVERDELEKTIDQDVFNSYWPKTEGRRVEKIRLGKPFNDRTLEIDFYLDRTLTVVEVEVGSLEEAENFPTLGKDITKDRGFKNKNLAK